MQRAESRLQQREESFDKKQKGLEQRENQFNKRLKTIDAKEAEIEQLYEQKKSVRERGNNFSAGQRQLLSFARTIIHKPSVMILDEATANIDTETEVLIQDSLEKLMNIGTMLIVAHRLSTIQHADNIIVLSKGEIVEQGNHRELLEKKGRYFDLYTLQYEKERLNKAN